MADPKPFLPDIPDDVQWLRASFLVESGAFDEAVTLARNYTGADEKFQNTSIGGNYAINIPPQFTHTADPLVKGIGSTARGNNTDDIAGLTNKADNIGMGRYFSEAIDDNKELLHLRFGVCEFNSIASFLFTSYDSDLGRLARTGEASEGLIERISKMMGKLAGFVAAIPIASFVTLVRAGNFVAGIVGWGAVMPQTKFYYIKSTMRLYWKAVNYMANTLAVNMGILPGYNWDGKIDDSGTRTSKYSFITDQKNNPNNPLSPKVVEQMHAALPDIFRKEGGIDVRAVANKAKRLEIKRKEKLMKILDDFIKKGNDNLETRQSAVNALEELLKTPDSQGGAYSPYDNSEGHNATSEHGWFATYLRSVAAKLRTSEESENINTEIETGGSSDAESVISSGKSTFNEYMNEARNTLSDWIFQTTEENGEPAVEASPGFKEYVEADFKSGSDWVTFRVTGDKTVTESFSNETGESALAEKINSTSGSIRDAKFNLAGGDIGIPVLQQAMEAVMGFGSAAIGSFAKWTGMDGLGVLLGGGFIDIPHTWKNSTASLPKIEYTIELRATYGNKISIFTDIYIPLLMLLASTLPLSTGRKSYTSPFLVEAYRKGRSQVRLGIVDSVSITRGAGNAAWSVDQLPLAVDVNLSISDLTQMVHMPIDDTIGAYDDDSGFTDYMATLGSLGLSDMTMYPLLAARAKAKFQYDWHNLIFNNSAAMASFFSNINLPIPGTNIAIKEIIDTFGLMGAKTTLDSRGG